MRKPVRILGLATLLGLGAILAAPRLLPYALGWLQPEFIFRADRWKKTIYLTIDDAPTNGTAEIRAVLAKHQVPATFFIMSGRVKTDHDLAAITKAGFGLGHHMRAATACSKLSQKEFEADFDSTDAVLQRVAKTKLFRPPSDFGTASQLAYVKRKGYTPVLGTVFPLDHWIENPRLLGWLVRWLAVPGGILIMHDGDKGGARTATVLDEVIPALKKAGYEFGDLQALARPPTTKPNAR